MGRRNDHSREEIRSMSLDAAEKLLEKHGPEKFSARRIATAIGYTVGTLYLVFANQDDLVFQLNLRTLRKLREHLFHSDDESMEPVARLKSLAMAYASFAQEHEHCWRMIYERPIPTDSDSLPEYQEVSRSLLNRVEEIIMQHHDDDKAIIAAQARALWGGVHGICILSLANKLDQGRHESFHGLIELLIDRFMSGEEPES